MALGTGKLNGGVATINTTTLPAGSDTVTATYAAAGNYGGSTSPATTLTIAAAPISVPGNYTVAASPTTLSVTGTSSAKTMLTFTPTGGYSGSVQLSCAHLPKNAICKFDQDQLTLAGDNKSVNMGLTIQAMGLQANRRSGETPALLALAFCWPGSITALVIFARRRKLVGSNRDLQLGLLLLCTGFVAAGLSGCGAHGTFTTLTSSTQVTVVATGTSGKVVTAQKVVLTLNMTE